MKDYIKDKDLARILIEGTKQLYGVEKSAQLKTELERQKKLPVYRGNAEELTAIVDRVFDEPVLQAEVVEAKVAESIDEVVQYVKPSMVKVAVKGTWNLAKKMHIQDWYYPIVGFLPGRYQKKIADKYGDDPLHYTVSNAVAESLVVVGLIGSINVAAGVLFGGCAGLINTVARYVIAQESENNSTGSPITCLPFYTTLYSITAFKAIKNVIIDAYSSALQEEKQKSRDKEKTKKVLVKPTLPDSYESPEAAARVVTSSGLTRVEEQKPEVVEEEFDEEPEEKVKKF